MNKMLPLRCNFGFPFGLGVDPFGNPTPQINSYPFQFDCSIDIHHGVDKDGNEYIWWEYIID